MSNAQYDQNGRATIICVSKNDGLTIIPAQADPVTHGLDTVTVTTGSDNGNNNGNAMIDENGISIWTALSSVDGKSIVEIYIDPVTKQVLTKLI